MSISVLNEGLNGSLQGLGVERLEELAQRRGIAHLRRRHGELLCVSLYVTEIWTRILWMCDVEVKNALVPCSRLWTLRMILGGYL